MAAGEFQQSVKGNTVTTMSMRQTSASGSVSVNSTDTMKFIASSDGWAAVVMDDEEIAAQSGSFSSNRFARLDSSQNMTAMSRFTAGPSTGSSLMFVSNNTKFQMTEGDNVNLSAVGESEHTHGGFTSQTSGSVTMQGLVSATVSTSDGDTSESLSMSNTFSSGGSLTENFGGYFINSIVVANGGGGDPSFAGQDLSSFPYPPSPLRQRLAAFAGRNLLIEAWGEASKLVDALFDLTFRAVESGFLAIGASRSGGGMSDAASDESMQHIKLINQQLELLRPKLQRHSYKTL